MKELLFLYVVMTALSVVGTGIAFLILTFNETLRDKFAQRFGLTSVAKNNPRVFIFLFIPLLNFLLTFGLYLTLFSDWE